MRLLRILAILAFIYSSSAYSAKPDVWFSETINGETIYFEAVIIDNDIGDSTSRCRLLGKRKGGGSIGSEPKTIPTPTHKVKISECTDSREDLDVFIESAFTHLVRI